jgi:hypothetical protein
VTASKNLKYVRMNLSGGSWVLWDVPIISALKRLRQEDCEFKASLSCRARHCLRRGRVGMQLRRRALMKHAHSPGVIPQHCKQDSLDEKM